MRLHRFYVSQPLGEEVVIENVSLIKQWTKVFRYTEGVLVILFNGDGNNYTYRVESVTTKSCKLVQVDFSSSYIPNKKITLYLSLIKKDNFELVVQKATELGVSTIVPVLSERSEKKNLNFERLHVIAVEAAEQCGRGDIPVISEIISLKDALGKNTSGASYILQMDGTSITHESTQDSLKSCSSVGLFIGPEGGWTPEEKLLCKEKKLTSIKLGNTVLRAETAAIVASSMFSFLA